MCGIAGYIGNIDQLNLDKAMESIFHRGPDGGKLVTLHENVHLMHRRLAIIDLSPAGTQPMFSHNGDLCLVFNGEIYNHQELKEKLKRNWRGSSDTEVFLEWISAYGLESALSEAKGMFALALYDLKKRIIYLARDRFGEKPLYYGVNDQSFFFSSELSTMKFYPSIKRKICRKSLKLYFKFGYIPSPHTIYEGIFKLKPGNYLEYDVELKKISQSSYWKLDRQQKFSGSFEEASLHLERKLEKTISKQMLADVPVGSFLSGGIDSTLITALMQKSSTQKISTFTVGFSDKKYNEAQFAKQIASHLGTKHTELYMTSKDALEVVPELKNIYSEPFADASQIPTYLISHLTRKHVTVAISGDAGDEVFGGYNRYLFAPKIYRASQKIPRGLRALARGGVNLFPANLWDSLLPFPSERLYKLSSTLSKSSPIEIYQRLLSHWDDYDNPVLTDEHLSEFKFEDETLSFEESMMLRDLYHYLPDDILTKVDRASMAVSLESRIPFLDHELVEFAWSLPLEFKIQNGISKRILREILYKYVPKNLIERPKQGFSVPLDSWLRNELRDWGESLLLKEKIDEAGLLNYSVIKRKWDEHQKGQRNWQHLLWDVLIFQDWYENSFIR